MYIYYAIILPYLVILKHTCLLNNVLWPLSQKVLAILRLTGYGESAKETDLAIGSVGGGGQKHFW